MNVRDNRIGGDTEGATNVIAASTLYGVQIADADGNIVAGNIIGLDRSRTVDLGNGQHGVFIVNNSLDNTIGGDTTAEGNIIAGNGGDGVHLTGADTAGNIVASNTIGSPPGSAADLGNTDNGIRLTGGAHHNAIGAANAGTTSRPMPMALWSPTPAARATRSHTTPSSSPILAGCSFPWVRTTTRSDRRTISPTAAPTE